MDRRAFLKHSSAALALSAFPGYAFAQTSTPKRVGLIGSGWYGKCDLFRLLQVAPVEVVSLCDVDSRMLADAADPGRRAPGVEKGPAHVPRLSRDARAEGPRHRPHRDARPLACAADDRGGQGRRRCLRAEADQRRHHRRPGNAGGGAQIQTRRAGGNAAPQHATSRRPRATGSSAKGSSARSAYVEVYCYYHMRAQENPPDAAPPEWLDYEMWTGPAPMRPYNKLVHPRSWRAFMEYGNGIVGDMCVHMLDMVRWMLDLGMPTRVSSTGGILVDKASKANITDTQEATFDFGDLKVVVDPSQLGRSAGSEVSLGRDDLRRQRHAQGQRLQLRLHSRRRRNACARGRGLRARAVSRRQDREGPRKARGAGNPRRT